MRSATALPDHYLKIQAEIIGLFHGKGIQAYTGMEAPINFGQFRGKLDSANHIKGVHRDDAYAWLTQCFRLASASVFSPHNVYAAEESQSDAMGISQSDAPSIIAVSGMEGTWPCRKTVATKQFVLRHTRTLKLPTTFTVTIEGRNYEAAYLSHGQNKTVYRLCGPLDSFYGGKVLKLSDLKDDPEPNISALLSNSNIITPLLARGVCNFDDDEGCKIDPHLAWVTVVAQPMDAALQEPLSSRRNMIVGALRVLLLAAQKHGYTPLMFRGKTGLDGSSRAKA